MAFMECSRVFAVVFTALILATAGFCLTLAGWFAPPINDSVKGVRLAGPILLVIGLVVLLLSCLMCAISQNRCCQECVQFCYDRRKDFKQRQLARTLHENHAATKSESSHNPLIHDQMEESFDSCTNIVNDEYAKSYAKALLKHKHHQSTVIGNTLHLDDSASAPTQCQKISKCVIQSPQSTSNRTFAYPDSEDYTDSTDTPSTSPIRQPKTYDGIGVRVKQYKSKALPYKNTNDHETRGLLDYSGNCSHSPTPSPFSSPHWPPKHTQSPLRLDQTVESGMNSKCSIDSPVSVHKYSDNVVLPKPGTFTERDPNVTGQTGSRHHTEGPVWAPRLGRWGPSPLVRDSGDDTPPPPYMDPYVIHSDV